jgi:hypothetical protein
LFKDNLDGHEDSILGQLVIGQFPDLSKVLAFFKGGFNHTEAKKSGKIIPKAGVDEDYDKVRLGSGLWRVL